VIDFGGVPLVRLRWKPSWPLSLAEQFDPDVTLDCHRRPVPGGLPQAVFIDAVIGDLHDEFAPAIWPQDKTPW